MSKPMIDAWFAARRRRLHARYAFLYSLLGRRRGSTRTVPGSSEAVVLTARATAGCGKSHVSGDASLKDRPKRGGGTACGAASWWPTLDGDTAVLYPVLSARSSLLTASLASKLNVLRGLDISFTWATKAAATA